MQVEQVDFVSVPTRDVERAVAFYRDALGLPESEVSDGEVEAPNVTLSFWNPEEDGEQFVPNVAGIAIRVADVEAARRELEQKGVEFLGETYDSGVCHMGFFKDPDGNTSSSTVVMPPVFRAELLRTRRPCLKRSCQGVRPRNMSREDGYDKG